MASSSQSAAFVALWSLHSKAIYAYIYSLVFNGPDADDIFQETAVVLLEKFDEFEPGTNFAAWACRVAHHKALKSLGRRRLPEFLDEHLLETLEQEAHRAADNLDQRLAALGVCMERLPVKDRDLVQSRYLSEISIEALAKQVGRSESLIYKSLARIHDTLLECIRRRLAEGDGP